MSKTTRNSHFKKLFLALLLNSLFLVLFVSEYTAAIEFSDSFLHQLFFTTTIFSHFSILLIVPLLVATIILYISKSTKYASITYCTLTSIVLIFLKIDSTIFSQFRYHLNPIVFDLVFGKRASDIFQFSIYNQLMSVAFVVIIILAQIAFLKIANLILLKQTNIKPKYYFITLLIATLTSNLIYAWGDANYDRFISQYKQILPIYYPLTADSLLMKLNLVNEEKIKQNENITANHSESLINYPHQTIESNPLTTKRNILFIAIDSWRFDCMTKEITPNIYEFSQRATQFTNHHSGSNMTTGGIFSIFYGIPATYFSTFTVNQKGPVLIDELLKQNYNVNIFSSSTVENPPFNRNVFVNIPNLRLHSDGETPSERDIDVLNDWSKKIDQQNDQPFFDFLFFDAAHGFDHPKNYKLPFNPSLKEVDYLKIKGDYNSDLLYNKYKNSLHFIDDLAGKVFQKLKEKELLNNTIIIITSDHGQEFNDNKKGFWQHGGNFSAYQVRVPLIIYDATQAAQKFNHLTLHYDFVPTIMKQELGVKNDLKDYTIGQNIYDQTDRKWFVCGYNQKYSVIEKNRITNIFESGNYQITDPQLNTLSEDLNFEVISEAFKINNSFYSKK